MLSEPLLGMIQFRIAEWMVAHPGRAELRLYEACTFLKNIADPGATTLADHFHCTPATFLAQWDHIGKELNTIDSFEVLVNDTKKLTAFTPEHPNWLPYLASKRNLPTIQLWLIPTFTLLAEKTKLAGQPIKKLYIIQAHALYQRAKPIRFDTGTQPSQNTGHPPEGGSAE